VSAGDPVRDVVILVSAVVHLALVLYRADQRARRRREEHREGPEP
jgi:hypothetical protein